MTEAIIGKMRGDLFMANMKYTIKDSVFTLLFRHLKYLIKLYLTPHSEDTDVKEADCRLITLEKIPSNEYIMALGLL